MKVLEDHPTVKAVRARQAKGERALEMAPAALDQEWLRTLCLEAGADDAGFVSIERAEMAAEREDIETVFASTRTLIALVFRSQRENIRSPARSVANKEFHAGDEMVTSTSRKIVSELEKHGVRGVYTALGFPLEAERFPGKLWLVSHKRVAEAAGLGRMGIHRNLIHPKFGNFVVLGTVLIDREVQQQGRVIDFNPCFECKLCVAACPVGAIAPDGHFDFSACYTHNYREFMGGFADYVETAVESKDRYAFRKQVLPAESVSMWQSLSYGSNYKAAYCMAVCPAGEDVIAPFLEDKAAFKNEILKPLQDKQEPVYVVPGTDAEAWLDKRFPGKHKRHVSNSLRPTSVANFLSGLPHVFQRHRADGLEGTYHFRFKETEEREATVTIRDNKLTVRDGIHGEPNLRVTAAAQAWIAFLEKQGRLPWLLLTRKIRLKGNPKWLLAFGRCFPK